MSDPYSRVEYRRFIAWPRRIAREWAFLEAILRRAPSRRLLDLGCGTGEHARFLAAEGFDVTAVDVSETMLAKAREETVPDNLRFVAGDLESLDDAVYGPFGGAICLGNTLPHLRTRDALGRFFAALRRLLLPEAPITIQLLNYERILASGVRHLPLNFRPQDEGEIVFLRLMRAHDDGRVTFFPSTLELVPDEDPPLRVRSAKRVELFGWRLPELRAAVADAGFEEIESFGAFGGAAYEPEASTDLILVVR